MTVSFMWVSHPVMPELMADATFIVMVGLLMTLAVKVCQWAVLLYRWLTTWNGDGEQGDLFEIEIHDESGRWRKLIAAVLVAVALGGTAVALQAYPLSCATMPPWTIEYWLYCYLAN